MHLGETINAPHVFPLGGADLTRAGFTWRQVWESHSQASRNNACRQRARAWECAGRSDFAFTVQLSNLHISRALYRFLKGPFILCWLETRQKSLNIPVPDASADNIPGLDPGLRTGLADFSVPLSLSAHALAGQVAGAEGGADEKGPWECHCDMGFPGWGLQFGGQRLGRLNHTQRVW